MNIMNLAALLNDDVPLSAITLGDIVLKRLVGAIEELRDVVELTHTGDDIEYLITIMDDAVLAKAQATTILTVLESQVVIHDITMFRQSLDYRQAQDDKWPNVMVTVAALAALMGSLYFTLYYVFKLNSSGQHPEGVVYDVLLYIFGWVKPILLYLL